METCICRICSRKYEYNRSAGCSKIQCNSCYSKEKKVKFKKKIIELLGGKCQNCGFNKCNSALELHHIDPSNKEFKLSGNHSLAWSKVKEEIKKCVLLCANCHRMYHHNCKENCCLEENNNINFQLKEYDIPNESPFASYEKDGRSLKENYYRRNNKYGTREQAKKAINNIIITNNKEKVKLVLESGIDFSKLGWRTKVSKVIKINPQKVGKWIKKNIPSLLTNAHSRK